MTRPPVGFDGHLSAAFADFPKIAYHATKRKNIASVILNGLFPGGLTTDGSPVKPYVMFSVEPNWMRTDNEGIRENAEIEVVIDLQLAALEGVRLLRTASGCLQTPDWISNRYITFIYDRRSNEPVWRNRAYGLYRQRLAAASQSTTEAYSIMSERDSELISRHGSGCLLDAYEDDVRSDFANWLELAGGGRNPYLLRFVDQNQHGLVINVAGQNRNVDLPDDVYYATTDYEHCIAEGIYRHGLYVFPNRSQVHLPNRQRLHPELWTAQVNIVFPTRVCKMCSCKHHDGFIHCMGCGARFEPHTDFSGLTQGSRERDVAAREGRPFNVMSLAPRAATHASRQRGHTASGEERMQQSAGAGLAKKVRNVANKINDRGRSRLTDLLSGHPWESYNYARHGLYVTTLEEIEVFQYIRTPNIGRENVTAHDARFAIAWREGAAEIDFARSCFLSWNDRFDKPEEAAIVIQATIRSEGQPPLRILRFNGEVCAFRDSSAAAIMSGLLDIFRRDLVHAKRGDRESIPTIHVRSGLHISEGLASVSSRQLNEMLANTRFYHHIYDGSVQTKFNRAFPRGRERYSPAERLGRERQYSAPAREPYTGARQAGDYMSAPPAPRTFERASGSGIARPTTPPKTPPKAPPRDPTTYISEQEFANIREGRYGRRRQFRR